MKTEKTNINFRVIGLYLITLVLSILILTRIIHIQHFGSEISTNSQPRYFNVEAPRGNILADDGSLLAISMPLYDIRMDLSVINEKVFERDIVKLSNSLSNLFSNKTADEYESFLRSSRKKTKNRYVLLKNKVTHNELKSLRKMPIFQLGQNRGGLIAELRPNRETPFGLLAKRTVGELRNVNPVGIERAYNQILSGLDGRHLKKYDKGIWVPEDSPGNIIPKAGDDVVTTINIDMQDVAEKALEKALISHNADWGCVVMMEVQT